MNSSSNPMKRDRHSPMRKRMHSGGHAVLALIVTLGLCAGVWAQGDILRRGISLMNAAREPEAEQVFRSLGPGDADYLSAQTYLGFLLLQRSALPQAEEAFRNVLNRQPENSVARLGLGMTEAHKGIPAEAGREFQQILTDPFVGLKAQTRWVESLFYDGKSDEALREAQRLATAYPSDAECHRLLGYLYQVQDQPGNALRAYLEAVRLAPDELSTYFSLISIYRSERDWANALRWVQRGLVLDENHPLLYQELAAVYDGLGRKEEAESARSEARRTYDAEILYTQAVNSRAAGRYDEVERLLRECTEKNPRLSKAWTDLGELLQRADRFADARLAYRNALEFSPQDSRAMLGLVTTLQKEGKEDEALRYFERAAAGGQLSPDLLTAMAAGLLKQGKIQQAMDAALQAARALPDDPDLLSYLGYMQQSNGRNQEALLSYSAALRLNPAQVDALVGQAQTQLIQGETRSSIASFRLAQKLDPSNTRIVEGLIQAYRQAGDGDSAESVCRACLKLDPKDDDCREQLAWLRMAARDYKESAAHYELLLSDGSASKSVLDGLAFSLMQTGKFDRAIELSERSLRQYGPDARVYANLGYLHRCIGDLAAAVSDYRHARDLDSGDAERNGDLGFVLYLARDYSGAVAPLQTALKLKPAWGMGHFNLALVYWNLREYELALSQARVARDLGVQGADSVVQTLERSVRSGVPRIVTVSRLR
jgi:superkiller protein 3